MEASMSKTNSICCNPEALALLAEQTSLINSNDALIGGAIAIAMNGLDVVDAASVDAQLQHYADTIRTRVRGKQPQALVAHLHDVLFEEEEFSGNTDDYYNVNNNFLPTVLRTKRGLPITLSLIYKDVAGRLGLKAHGLNLPGHFLVGVEIDDSVMMIDPFSNGRIVNVDEAHARLRQIFGDEVEWSDELLKPASHRLWLTRMLQNLLNTYSSRGQYRDVAAMLEMEMVLWPGEVRLQRDLALVLARCGMSQPARVWLDRYLKGNPDDPQNNDLRQLLEVLAA
jgi:regulator of sirC expression with transglutaminase-like and TPR domain